MTSLIVSMKPKLKWRTICSYSNARRSNIVILSDEGIKVLCHVYEYGK